MAAFREHFLTGIGVGYAAGVACAVGPWSFHPVTPFFVFAGASAGALLPDLDSDNSTPFSVAFSLLAVVGGAVAFLYCRQQTLLPWYAWMAIPPIVALFIRFAVGWFFQKLTVHRGIIHSIPMAAIVTCAMSLALSTIKMAQPDVIALSLSVGLGFLSHLLLDEIYSAVDFDGGTLAPKKSFGTALCLSSPSMLATVCAYMLLVGLCYFNLEQYGIDVRQFLTGLTQAQPAFQ